MMLKFKKHNIIFLSSCLLLLLLLCGCRKPSSSDPEKQTQTSIETESLLLSQERIPDYEGTAYVEINNNQPDFDEKDKTRMVNFESYSELDSLGRCGRAFALICKESMPTEERGIIGEIKPSGWHTVKYNDRIEGNYLYNRCHLIGYQLTGENANEKNLITGSRYLNIEGMLPFENEVAAYVRETNHHVLYRATPIFKGNNLLASGVQLEAWSIEDKGKGICFNVYCYNVQPGILIDYASGDSQEDPNDVSDDTVKSSNEKRLLTSEEQVSTDPEKAEEKEYILNRNTHKIHLPSCSSLKDMKEKNKLNYSGDLEELREEGYTPCQRCLGSR